MRRAVWLQWFMRWIALCAQTRRAMWGLTAAWVVLVSWGISALLTFEQTPGVSGGAITTWPPVSRLRPNGLRPTLLMFVHSQCACSRASLAELEQIMMQCRGRMEVHVLFYRPASQRWPTSELWQRASAMAGVQVSWDEGGVEASRFAARTSGDTMLWSPTGELLFRGGITVSRGHLGENPGSRAVISLLLTRSASTVRSPVFGCAVKGRDNSAVSAEVRR